MTDNRRKAVELAGDWVCNGRGSIGRRQVTAETGISDKTARWLVAAARAVDYDVARLSALLTVGPAPKLVADPVPSADEPIEELIERRCREFRRMEKADLDEHVIRVKEPGPIGILIFGDPHVDDPGTDFPLLQEHIRLVQETEGLFAADAGDANNNWQGRLMRLHADQSVTARDAWRLVEWMYKSMPWAFSIAGNHVLWGDGPHVFERILAAANVAVANNHEAKIRLEGPDWTYRIWARHDFAGKSQWNSVHGMLKAMKMREYKADLYVAGHTHDPAMYTEPRENGQMMTALRVGSYKRVDDYAIQGGFPRKRGGEAALLVIDRDRSHVTFDIESGVDYLRFLRSR